MDPVSNSVSMHRNYISRRAALRQFIGATAVLASSSRLLANAPAPVIRVTSEELSHIPEKFSGLSYESSQLAHPRFFSAENRDLVRYFRTLDDCGVLRLGGNMSEFTVWDPNGVVDDNANSTEGPDPGNGTDKIYTITPRSIDNLAGFLKAADWELIYGLNLARGKVDSCVEEAKYVVKSIGDRLIALQLGNEPDLFKHKDDPRQHWSYEEFVAKWNDFYAAIRTALPKVPIAGPDTSNPKWNLRFAQETGHELVLETSHFYAEGPPTDPRMNIEYLLHPADHLQSYVTQAVEVSRQSSIPYRMSEGNTCYAAGKAGVSDTFASALWVLDFMLTLAQSGATGVNLHGGASGLYTPIAGSIAEGYTARPIYYGMLLFRPLLGGTLLRTQVEGTTKNVTAYTVRNGDALRVVVLNREPGATNFELVLPPNHSHKPCKVWRLEAPSVESTTGVTLANATVARDGRFQPTADEIIPLRKARASIRLAPYSAALIIIPL